MIDNIKEIKELLNFSDKNDFYMLYVFKRKKDQPEGERDNHQSVRTIKTYCIDSVEHFEDVKDKGVDGFVPVERIERIPIDEQWRIKDEIGY